MYLVFYCCGLVASDWPHNQQVGFSIKLRLICLCPQRLIPSHAALFLTSRIVISCTFIEFYSVSPAATNVPYSWNIIWWLPTGIKHLRSNYTPWRVCQLGMIEINETAKIELSYEMMTVIVDQWIIESRHHKNHNALDAELWLTMHRLNPVSWTQDDESAYILHHKLLYWRRGMWLKFASNHRLLQVQQLLYSAIVVRDVWWRLTSIKL